MLLAEERRQKMAEIVSQRGFVPLGDLVNVIGVSESTVRRDLDFLNDAGVVRRTHGGAAAPAGERHGGTDRGAGLTGFDDRRQLRAEEKARIAATMAALIRDGETVLLDGGTTTYEVAKRLVGRSLQIFTNSIPVANLLSGSPGIELVLVGGVVYPKTGVALGPIATATLEGLHVQRLIMGVAGITARGLFNGNLLLVETERAMMRCAEETNVVADSGKFGMPGLAFLCGWDGVQRVVSDDALEPELRGMVGAHVDLVLAPAAETLR